jgi:hypothetical protein
MERWIGGQNKVDKDLDIHVNLENDKVIYSRLETRLCLTYVYLIWFDLIWRMK